MTHKVFINDKPLYFEDVYNQTNVSEKGLSILSDSEFLVDDVIKSFSITENPGIIYLSSSPDQAWTDFTKRFVIMEAAGGLVTNDNDEFLVIYRKKKWDLPKGKLEFNETPEDGSVREVKEECGIKNLERNSFLMKTFHTYTEKNKYILKKTHWFNMSTDQNEKLIPQTEEDIEKVKWMSKEMVIEKVFSKTYNSIKDVFLAGFEFRKKNF